MVIMTRSFLPIGQGAFYCESFDSDSGDRINMVYDCGSSTSHEILVEQIDNTFEEGEAIEALFISHFDNDHVNGIEHLFSRCNVKNVFLPVVTPINRNIITILTERLPVAFIWETMMPVVSKSGSS